MKKLIYGLCILLLAVMLPISYHKEIEPSLSISGNWESYKQPITQGSGTREDPYLINSAEELAYLNDFLKEGNNRSAIYKMTTNIDLSAHYFSTIQEMFKGTLDGNQNAIIGLTTNEDVGAGLFNSGEDCTVKNLVFENVLLTSNGVGHTGALFANIYRGIIVNVCVMSGQINVNANCAWAGLGGIIGWSKNSHVSFCYNSANINCTSEAIYGYYIGGVIGCQVYEGTLDNLVNYGKIEVTGLATGVVIGGIVGENLDADLINSWSDTIINTNLKDGHNGALSGYNSKSMVNCYYNSNLPADSNSGNQSEVYTDINELPSTWDRAYWDINPNINNGKPYLKWLYWQSYVG